LNRGESGFGTRFNVRRLSYWECGFIRGESGFGTRFNLQRLSYWECGFIRGESGSAQDLNGNADFDLFDPRALQRVHVRKDAFFGEQDMLQRESALHGPGVDCLQGRKRKYPGPRCGKCRRTSPRKSVGRKQRESVCPPGKCFSSYRRNDVRNADLWKCRFAEAAESAQT
jgi:hypothetical protein